MLEAGPEDDPHLSPQDRHDLREGRQKGLIVRVRLEGSRHGLEEARRGEESGREQRVRERVGKHSPGAPD